jgi:hypothetical protein
MVSNYKEKSIKVNILGFYQDYIKHHIEFRVQVITLQILLYVSLST